MFVLVTVIMIVFLRSITISERIGIRYIPAVVSKQKLIYATPKTYVINYDHFL